MGDQNIGDIYEVCKLSNETGNIAPDLATLWRRDLEGRFCFRLGHSATDTFAKLQHAHGDSVFLRAQVFRWFKAFSEERESIANEPRSGRLSSSRIYENVDRMRILCVQIRDSRMAHALVRSRADQARLNAELKRIEKEHQADMRLMDRKMQKFRSKYCKQTPVTQ
ncbi:hypothetical protein NQ318_003363, partial [Aromia moschata]